MRLVVCGPPGSGKTTWVEEHRKPGELVWDLDRIAETVFRLPTFPRPPDASNFLDAVRNTALEWLRLNRHVPAYVIVADEKSAEEIAVRIGAAVHLCGKEKVHGGKQE